MHGSVSCRDARCSGTGCTNVLNSEACICAIARVTAASIAKTWLIMNTANAENADSGSDVQRSLRSQYLSRMTDGRRQTTFWLDADAGKQEAPATAQAERRQRRWQQRAQRDPVASPGPRGLARSSLAVRRQRTPQEGRGRPAGTPGSAVEAAEDDRARRMPHGLQVNVSHRLYRRRQRGPDAMQRLKVELGRRP